MSRPLVSVVIVSYNTRDKLRQCLTAIEPEHQVVVVDNASEDGSVEMVSNEFPAAVLIRNSANQGFGAANNRGADAASGDLILYLNSDAYAEPGAIGRLAAVFADPGIAAAGGRLLNPDGSLQNSSANALTLWAVFCEQLYLEKLFPRSGLFSPYWNTRRLVEAEAPAGTAQIMGACLMVRRGAPGFDERYFLYCEDTDLCRRISEQGRIVYVKNASFTHDLGSSSQKDPLRAVALYNRGKELYFLIHHGKFASWVCRLLDRTGALMRSAYWSGRAFGGRSEEARRMARGFSEIAFGRSRGQRVIGS